MLSIRLKLHMVILYLTLKDMLRGSMIQSLWCSRGIRKREYTTKVSCLRMRQLCFVFGILAMQQKKYRI